MSREIEIKARISDPGEIRRKLFNQAVLNGTFEKQDIYWIKTNGENDVTASNQYGIRVRREKFIYTNGNIRDTAYVTWKDKEIRGNMEFNDEREFEVSSAALFEEFLHNLGFKKKTTKLKKGTAHTWGNITAEVAEIEKLGWFVELEIVMNNKDEKLEQASGENLLNTLDMLGIERTDVETRSYSQMLAELPAGRKKKNVSK